MALHASGQPKRSNRSGRILGALLYTLGIILGAVVGMGSVWADFEASLFESGLPAEEPMTTLICPPLLVGNEVGSVTATFANPTARSVNRIIRVVISDDYVSLAREIDSDTTLAAGETRILAWPITAEDVVWNRFVLVRVNVLRTAPLPSLTGSCGTVYVDLPWFSGWQVLWAVLLLTFASMGAGMALWLAGQRPLKGRTRSATMAMILLAGVILASMGLGLGGWWAPGGVALVFAVLLVVVLIAWALEGVEG